MRREDGGDYLALRRIAANPWETVRFRKTRRPGQMLGVRIYRPESDARYVEVLARVACIHREYHDMTPEDPRKPDLGRFVAAHSELVQ